MDLSLLQPYLPYAVGLAVILVAVKLLRSILSKGGDPEYTEKKQCRICGWSGAVSRYHSTCPSCGARIG